MSSNSTPSSASITSGQVSIEMTSEQQGVFYEFFKGVEIPSWLAQASSEARDALRTSVIASQRSRAEALTAMIALKAPQQFCEPLLSQAMAEKLGEPLDIRGVVFQHIRSTSSLFGLRKKLVLPIDRDLLIAACENFEANETLVENYDDKSLIYQPERINGAANKILAIKPHEFAQLCRTLDLGKHYQTHLNSVFEPYIDTGSVRKACMAHSQCCLDVDRHLALMKKHISEKVFRMLGEVVEKKSSIKLDRHTIAYKQIELLGHKLHGAMLIVAVNDGAYNGNPCVLYLPGDTTQPLKEYVSVSALEYDLGVRLSQESFETALLRFVLLADRAGLHAALASRGLRAGAQFLQSSQRASVPVTAHSVSTDLFAELYRQRVEHVMADARLLVVPTDEADEKTRLARLETYKTIGLDIAFFSISFIPVVGEVLMALTAAELLLGVYHGIERWSAGEQEQAADYLFDTLENFLVMAALSAGAGAVKGTFKTVRGSSFVQNLRQVRLADEKPRLWKPDLAPYRRSISLPGWVKTDERGLRWFDDQAYLALGKDLYAVRPQADTGLWEIEGTRIKDGYAPRLETNDVGAWRHDSELPGEWDRLTLFRRLGYSERDIPDPRALQILSVSAVDERVMRRVLIDRISPPAMLIDTVRRFAVDQTVIAFIEQMKLKPSAPMADADLQLRLVTTLKTWPAQTAINVVDGAGESFSRFMAPDVESTKKTITLSLEKVRTGQFYPDLLAGLNATERERLLDSPTKVAAEQINALIEKLAEQADRKRLALFKWIYQRGAPVSSGRTAPLRDGFSDLPISVLDELVRYADASELDELDAGKVPLRLAEEARRFQQVVRVNRAYEGLYLDAAGGIDTDRLVFSALKHLPGWKSDLYVRMLEWSFYTDESASLGSENSTQKLLMNAHPDRYDVLDEHYNVVSYLPGRTRANYFQALWEGLSQARRTALGVQLEDHGVALREKITALVLARRASAEQALGMRPPRPGYVSPMRLADTLLGKASGGMPTFATTSSARSPGLIRRAQELYPTHSREQIDAFLAGLGQVDVLVLRKLESLRLEYLTIRQVLENWIKRDSWSQIGDGPRRKVSTLAKTRAAQEITRCWRRETPSSLTLDGRLYELTLPPLPLGDLPLIMGDFSHVGVLFMDRVGASSGLNSFLHNFKYLRHLSLIGNGLTRLQQAIGAMSRLERLNLSENQIQLTDASVTELAGLTRLKQLNLNANPALSRVPDVSQMQQLQRLELRGTGISQWPNGATGLARLELLDLRDNRISVIPEDVFAASGVLNQGTNISGNPLTSETRKRLLSFQQASNISLGLIALGYAEGVQDVLMDSAMSSTWLTGATEIDVVQKRTLWSSVYAYPDSRPFFLLLSQLRYTADFRMVYRSLSQRVWDVMEAAAEDSALRRTLFRMADVGQISADGSSLLFSDLHVRVLCYRAMNAARVTAGTQEAQLAQLLRGLYRLQEVERFAVKNVISRSRTGPVTLDQAMQISLAYRVGLAERLNLPAQPRDMNFRLDVEVIPQTLDWVFAEVVKLEQTTALADWMTRQEFWTQYLEGAHRTAFDETVFRAAMSFELLGDRVHLTSEQFTQQMGAIVDNYVNERAALIKRLTGEALQRNPGLALPAPADNENNVL